MKVIKAISQVAASMSESGIGKTRRNVEQKYQFRGIDDVLNALASEYAKAGLVVVPSYDERIVTERTSKSGYALFSVTVKGTFTLYSAEDGSNIQSGPYYGEAMDTADKATNKAMSAAYKYFAIQTFAIPTEGDNDADLHTHEVAAQPQRQPVRNGVEPTTEAPITEQQKKMLAVLAHRVYGPDADDKRHELVEAITKGRSKSSNDLTKAEASRLIDGLQSKATELGV